MIAWPEGVNRDFLRDTSWDLSCGFIKDQTRSGKPKRRAANSLAPDTLSCILHMRQSEYDLFEYWFKHDCRRGAISVALPKINGINKNDIREYVFSSEKIAVNNIGGDVVEVKFDLEEVL